MVDTFFFVLQLIGLVVLVFWAIANDGVPDDGRTRGLLAMREPDDDGGGGGSAGGPASGKARADRAAHGEGRRQTRRL